MTAAEVPVSCVPGSTGDYIRGHSAEGNTQRKQVQHAPSVVPHEQLKQKHDHKGHREYEGDEWHALFPREYGSQKHYKHSRKDWPES